MMLRVDHRAHPVAVQVEEAAVAMSHPRSRLNAAVRQEGADDRDCFHAAKVIYLLLRREAESGLQDVNIKVQNMHPSEMKNQALVAAVAAENDGFPGTATALRELADICANEARLFAEYQMRDFLVSCGNATSGRKSRTSFAN